MADKKISELLPSLTGLASGDLLVAVDVSAGTTNSVPFSALESSVSRSALLSSDAGQLLEIGTDSDILLDSGSLISTDASNALVAGTDGKLYTTAGAIPDASIAVAKLANGTDGELITWDASGVATTVAAGTAGQVLTSNGAGAAPSFADITSLTSATAQSPSGATTADFTSIPSWVKKITVTLFGLSTTGGSNMVIQLGTGGSPTTTGYNVTARNTFTTSAGATSYTSGFVFNNSSDASRALYGQMVFTKHNGNKWVGQGGAASALSCIFDTAGGVSLSGALDMIRVTTENGSPTFDAGEINILYE